MFRSVPREGLLWLVFVHANGDFLYLYPQCRIGERHRPGQRMIDHEG
ncbi:hypothetical protein KNJ79_05275 [Sphingopyxis indica]|nr:hypothetical protein [Sphingopyxis indica]WOF44344.1 hypothetical protein KNJ79_05275 [Sphingopyxis indica]